MKFIVLALIFSFFVLIVHNVKPGFAIPADIIIEPVDGGSSLTPLGAGNTDSFRFRVLGFGGSRANSFAESEAATVEKEDLTLESNNPPWTVCTAQKDLNIKRLNLIGMSYDLLGTFPLKTLLDQLSKDNASVVLKVNSNFVNNMNFVNIRSQDLTEKDNIPFKIKGFNTSCKYRDPSAISKVLPGADVQTDAGVFRSSNPPFLKCNSSDGSTYSIKFSISPSDFEHIKDKKFSNEQKIRINIIQSIASNNFVKDFAPGYSGELIIDPDISNKKYNLIINSGLDINTECYAGSVP